MVVTPTGDGPYRVSLISIPEVLVPSQTMSPGPTSYSTAVELFPSSSADVLDNIISTADVQSTQGPVTSATIDSSPQPSTEPPTDSGSSSVIVRVETAAVLIITVFTYLYTV